MHARRPLIFWGLICLWISLLACNAPTPTPRFTFPDLTASPLAGETPPTETPTLTPTLSTPTPTPSPSPTPTETPTPTPTDTPTPTRPVSTGPLDFPTPGALDEWVDLGNGEYRATIIVRITGGAPVYTVYHDTTRVATSWEQNVKIVFQARDCSAMVHTITVKSADGQSVSHKYWIPAPWCP